MKTGILLRAGSMLLSVVACSGSGQPSEDAVSNVSALDTPIVVTGAATDVAEANARLGVTVTNIAASGASECGVCWGPQGSGANWVEQTSAAGVRCMRQIPCLNATYYTSDGYMAPNSYVLGTTYEYKAYALNGDGIPYYGSTKTFSVPQKATVITGAATEVTASYARLGVAVTADGGSPVSECGVCWSPTGVSPDFVTQTTASGVRCMRQIPCLGAAYYTSDGYMNAAPYVAGTTYSYRGYALNGVGVAYGESKSFTPVSHCYSIGYKCYDWFYGGSTSNYWLATTNKLCGASAYDVYLQNIPRSNGGVCRASCAGTIPPPPMEVGCCCELSGVVPF